MHRLHISGAKLASWGESYLPIACAYRLILLCFPQILPFASCTLPSQNCPKVTRAPRGMSSQGKKRKADKPPVTIVSQKHFNSYSSSYWDMLFQLIFKCSTVKASHTFCIEFYPFKVLFHEKPLFSRVEIFGFSEFTSDDLGKLEENSVKTNSPLQ